METTVLGRNGPVVGALGLGCMGMSPGIYGPADDAESIATLHSAVEAGVTLLDTGDDWSRAIHALSSCSKNSIIGGCDDVSGGNPR